MVLELMLPFSMMMIDDDGDGEEDVLLMDCLLACLLACLFVCFCWLVGWSFV